MLTRDDNHVYRWNGDVVPGVTQLMGDLQSYTGIPEGVLEFASERGRAVHHATAIFDRDLELDEESLDYRIRPYLDAWMLFTQRENPDWAVVEEMLYDPVNRYAGEPDRAGWVLDGWAVVDIKTTAALHPAFGVQLAGYKRLVEVSYEFDPAVTMRYVVHLLSDGTYRIQQYKDRMDEIAFASCLALHQWRQRCQTK